MILDTEELRKYREKEIEAMVRKVSDMYKNNVTPDYFKGVIDAFRDIILLPKKMQGANDEQRKLADLLIKEAMELLEKRTTRALLEGE